MYIIPDTTIRIIRNCPLDNSYQHTIFFKTATEQYSYFFTALHGYTFENNSYQRAGKGKLRIAMNAERMYDCNYLAFKNTSFVGKWFYAFVTGVEYINNITSEITYEIDVMQTWHFDYKMLPSFVEREHAMSDEIGDNLVPENLDTGEYVETSGVQTIAEFRPINCDIILWSTVNEQYRKTRGYWNDNNKTVSGLYPVDFENSSTGANAMKYWIDHAFDEGLIIGDPVVCATVCPHVLKTTQMPIGKRIEANLTLLRTDGTQVKNNKCLTYPYNFIYVTTNNGKSAVYRYEFFNRNAVTQGYVPFDIYGSIAPNASISLFPVDYKGQNENYDEALQLTGFPQIAWNNDAFKAWLAQNATSIGLAGISGAYGLGSALEDGMTGGGAHLAKVGAHSALGATAVGGVNVAGILGVAVAVSGAMRAFMPPQAKGNVNGFGLFSAGLINYFFYQKHITPEFATIIDDYFSMFGYATHKVKIPNRNGRFEWNYVKTLNCKIDGGFPSDVTQIVPTPSGGLPADAMRKIEEIYNNGITFWNDPLHVGDYNHANPIIGGE